MEQINLFTAFIFGLLSFISPCVLPIVPGYISFISGSTLEDLKDENGNSKINKKVIFNALAFIFGFSLIFILLGAAATKIGIAFNDNLPILSKFAGVLIVIFGLHMIGLFKISFLNYEKRFQLQEKKFGVAGSFLIGMAFAFGWTPCIGPVLGAILSIAAQQETISEGILLLTSYSLGLGIPFLITAISINLFFSFFNKIKKYFHTIEVVGGILLVIVGVLVFTNYLSILASKLQNLLPFLNDLS
ncbi:MAG: cytochrome c biogenesis protein CcdA [Bacteroidota bacterium]